MNMEAYKEAYQSLKTLSIHCDYCKSECYGTLTDNTDKDFAGSSDLMNKEALKDFKQTSMALSGSVSEFD